MDVESQMIFDIGAHKGDDASVYLQQGFKVVSVEANPQLISILENRFKKQIGTGQLHIIHAAITLQNEGEVILNVHDDTSKSSLVAQPAKHQVPVACRTLSSLIAEFGLPFYCKIDIEGSDLNALKSLLPQRTPLYISVEISGSCIKQILNNEQSLFATIDQLFLLGYNKFKLVDQEKLVVLTKDSFYKKSLQLNTRIKYKLQHIFSQDNRSRFLKQFELEKNAEISGLPSHLLPGEWYGYEKMKEMIATHFREFAFVARNKEFIFWVDLHATIDA
jgi:FkbM family methyltransferase